MEILVCVKRVPMVGGTIVVTADGQDVDTRMSGFTVSPHEECAVEEALRISAAGSGGEVTVLTLGLFLLVLNALMVWLVASIQPGFHVGGFRGAFLTAIIVWLTGWIGSWFIGHRGFERYARR